MHNQDYGINKAKEEMKKNPYHGVQEICKGYENTYGVQSAPSNDAEEKRYQGKHGNAAKY